MMRHEENVNGYGEIVEVQGGHIVRSTGKKDRHSKVCTAKGPRDRRVRLSAPTAIQFYDVQDRLGFDRPSKAVDWLITKAKSAIDDLDQLPPWNPADTLRQRNSKPRRRLKTKDVETETMPPPQNYHQQQPLPPSSDLCLSLQNGQSFGSQTEHALFSGQSSSLGFDWEQNQRLVTWNNGGVSEGGGGFVFGSSPVTTTTTLFQPLYGQSTQRGSLQSINTPMIRAWFDPNHQSMTTDDLHHHHQTYHVPHQSAIPGIAFASNGEFSGFRVPARFHGDEQNTQKKA